MATGEFVRKYNYSAWVNETQWGQFPGSPAYYHVPVFDYTVKEQRTQRQATPFIGLLQNANQSVPFIYPGGTISTSPYGWKPTNLSTSLMQCLLDWAFANPETQNRASKSIEWYEGPNIANKRHLGLRVDQATLRGSVQSKIITLDMDVKGQLELGQGDVSVAQTLPTNRNKLAEPLFKDVTFTVNDVAIGIEAFALRMRHGLQVVFNNSGTPTYLPATNCDIDFLFVPTKTADTYDSLRRAFGESDLATTVLSISGLHNGTGSGGTSSTVATFTLNRLGFRDAQEAGGQGLAYQQVDNIGLKPDTSDNAITIAYSEV